jgi:hypothetical protein
MSDQRCGTYAGAKLHSRRKEANCEPCRLAAQAYNKERKNRPRTRQLKLSDPIPRFWEKVEKTKTCWTWTAAIKPNGYGAFWDGEHLQYAHRYSFELTSGAIPDGMQIDHRCHNRACVNPSHLRAVTGKQNTENLSGLRADNTSGYRGVTWDKRRNAWIARVYHNKRNHHVGYFSTAKEAGQAAANRRLELFTHNDIDRRAA